MSTSYSVVSNSTGEVLITDKWEICQMWKDCYGKAVKIMDLSGSPIAKGTSTEEVRRILGAKLFS
jgi:hypothetical protein